MGDIGVSHDETLEQISGLCRYCLSHVLHSLFRPGSTSQGCGACPGRHRPDEKKRALSGVSNVPSHNALEFVEGYLEDGQIKAAAKIAYEKISDLLKTGLRRRTAPRLQNRQLL